MFFGHEPFYTQVCRGCRCTVVQYLMKSDAYLFCLKTDTPSRLTDLKELIEDEVERMDTKSLAMIENIQKVNHGGFREVRCYFYFVKF